MSDFVRTQYCIKGEKETLDKLYDFMKEHASGEDLQSYFAPLYTTLGEESYVPDPDDDFYETDDERNYAYKLKRTEDAVEFVTETLGFSCVDKFIKVIGSHFPGISTLYEMNSYDGESGALCTNDVEYERFKTNWMVKCEENYESGTEEYFERLEDVLKYVGEFFGVEIDYSAYREMDNIDGIGARCYVLDKFGSEDVWICVQQDGCRHIDEQLQSDLEKLVKSEFRVELYHVTRSKDEEDF